MLEYIYKVNKFRVNFEDDEDGELQDMYEVAQYEDMYMDVEFFKLGAEWSLDIYLSSREDNFAMLLDKVEMQELVGVEELKNVDNLEEMEKILLKKINEMYVDGEFVRYIDEYFDMRP